MLISTKLKHNTQHRGSWCNMNFMSRGLQAHSRSRQKPSPSLRITPQARNCQTHEHAQIPTRITSTIPTSQHPNLNDQTQTHAYSNYAMLNPTMWKPLRAITCVSANTFLLEIPQNALSREHLPPLAQPRFQPLSSPTWPNSNPRVQQ